MTRTLLKNFVDTFANQARQGENFGKSGVIRLDTTASNVKRGFLFAGGGPAPGVYVLDATLTLHAHKPWSGTQDVTLRRIITPWKERTLTWHKQPDSTGDGASTTSVGPLDHGAAVEFDVTDIVRDAFLGTGTPFYGFEMRGGDDGSFAWSSSEADAPEVRPRLEVHFTTLPAAAYDLVPGDGQVVSVAKPVLRWSYFDPDAEEQQAFQVQIDDTGDFDSPDFDSGEITSLDSQLVLADTAFGGIADAGGVTWRVRVQDASGQWGPYSDPVAITRVSKGVLTINAPTAEIEETTPTIATTLADHDLRALEYLLEEDVFGSGSETEDVDGWGDEAWGTDAWGSVILAEFGNVLGSNEVWHEPRFKATADADTAYEFDVPKKIIKRRTATYRLTVRAWDTTEHRVATPGDPNYSEASVVFTWVNPAAPPAAVTAFTAVAEAGGGPGIALHWTRASVPDFYHLMIDGVIVAAGHSVEGLEWQVAGTSYGVTYYGTEPGVPHTFEVIAVVESGGVKKTSADNPTATATANPVGIWLTVGDVALTADPVVRVQLLSQDASPAAIGQSSEMLYPVGRQAPIEHYDSIRGYEDRVSGFVQSAEDRLVLEALKGLPESKVRLTMGDLSIIVRLSNMTLGRYPTERGVYTVEFDVYQVGDFAIPSRLR